MVSFIFVGINLCGFFGNSFENMLFCWQWIYPKISLDLHFNKDWILRMNSSAKSLKIQLKQILIMKPQYFPWNISSNELCRCSLKYLIFEFFLIHVLPFQNHLIYQTLLAPAMIKTFSTESSACSKKATKSYRKRRMFAASSTSHFEIVWEQAKCRMAN